MERKLGKTFPIMCKGKLITVEVVADETCDLCSFKYLRCINNPDVLRETGNCSSMARKDKTSVVFKECKA